MASIVIGELKQRWARFLRAAKLREENGQMFHRLISAYTEPSRHYHGAKHIRHCLEQLDLVRKICPGLIAVEASIWFHDVVYDADRKDNEFLSARVAAERLHEMGMPQPTISVVEELILNTRHQEMPMSRGGKFMVDIDLSGLGQSPARFNADGRDIRKEYAHIDDAVFNKGRAALFQRLLDRPTIYATPFFRDRYEEQARQNLSNSLRRLRGT